MNRLQDTRAYLAGPMDRVKDGGTVWRENLTPKLKKLGIKVFDPCKKPTDVGEESSSLRAQVQLLKEEAHEHPLNYGHIEQFYKPICAIDLRMIDIVDFVIVYIDTDVHMAGTYHELSTAIQQKKPTLLVCHQGKSNIPNWWFGVVPHELMFSSFDDMEDYLIYVDTEKHYDHLKRWRFFNLDET